MEERKIIPFPKQQIQLTAEETVEHQRITDSLREAKTFRALRKVKKELKEFKRKVASRIQQEKG